MKYLVDSDWVADYLKGRSRAVMLLDGLLPDGIAMSVITFGEIYEGIYYGSEPRHNEMIFRRFLQGVSILDITRPIARHFAIIRGSLREKGLLIPQPDILIGATAIYRRIALVTRNYKDFQRIPNLKLYHASSPA
jgi:tRNA(fMet)-specific endonuclease VapC